MQLFLGVGYFLVGLVQLFAIIAGIDYALGWGTVVSAIIALFITYIPIIGSVAGMYGAVNVWDWSIWQAGVLFFWYVPVLAAMVLYGAVFDR
jgi:hypothetical protein